MSLNQYSWVIAMAAAWSANFDPQNPHALPIMAVIDAVSGQLANHDDSAANDDDIGAYRAMLAYLLVRAASAKSIVFLTLWATFCAKLIAHRKLAAIPHSPSISQVFPVDSTCAITFVPSHNNATLGWRCCFRHS
jgi:hypothetical protein